MRVEGSGLRVSALGFGVSDSTVWDFELCRVRS